MNNTLSTPTANDARSLTQSLRSKGLPSLALVAERLGKHITALENQLRTANTKIEEQTARIKELESALDNFVDYTECTGLPDKESALYDILDEARKLLKVQS